MKRLVEQDLTKWYASPYKKPLIIRGARQVGKSSLVRQFAAQKGLTLHEVNLERHVTLATVFASNDPDKILQELAFLCDNKEIRGENSLLFLDEIQAVPEAIAALRYFYEDYPDFPVIAAGSLLEFTLSAHSFSMPVGRIQYLFLEPMSFTEMLLAMKEENLLSFLQSYQLTDDFPLTAHQRLLELQRIYLLIGGMPEAVQRYVDTKSFEQVSEVHASIVDTYRDDFAKYAQKSTLFNLHRVFDYVPSAIGEKFKYVNVDPNTQARDIRKAFDLLLKAQVIRRACHTDGSGLPLRASINDKIFKPFFLDCGLVNHICGVSHISIENMLNKRFINEGKLAEQFIAQHLNHLGSPNTSYPFTYWLREGRSANAEVDFLVQLNQTVVPLEIKAGKSGTLKSLLQFIYQKNLSHAVRFDLNRPTNQEIRHVLHQTDGNKEVVFTLLSLPLYLIEQLPRLFSQSYPAETNFYSS
ncbi:MAG: AAA family ATPase [Desulfocapsa sp.]|nr:MAG: AAA family ATPase [Desulfocapsa sp.]